MKMTLIHHPPTTTTHTNSMSAISQLLLTRFQPNFIRYVSGINNRNNNSNYMNNNNTNDNHNHNNNFLGL